MIKGLYFKLNMNKPTDKDIYNFFINESKKRRVNKIDILYSAMLVYKAVWSENLKTEDKND